MIERFAILGAAGDLTRRYLMPALARLSAEGAFEPSRELEVVGVARDDWSTADFRARIRAGLEELAPDLSREKLEAFVRRLRFARSDVTDPQTLKRVLEPARGPVVAYLALPPAAFGPTIAALSAVGLADGSRIVVEKPFGDGLASARELNGLLHDSFDERSVFRIDHFLGKQTAQNLLGLRFANRLFEPIWNNQHIERVEIRWDETLALEGRAAYYDRAGALRDMLQNHLLQLLCLVAMEPPTSLGERDLRDRKVDVLRAVRRLSGEEIAKHTLRARYGAGTSGARSIPAYVDEDGVDPARDTETFAQATLLLDNWRWSGVPFTLRSGKALAEDRHEITVHFRPVPHLAFGQDEDPAPNAVRITFDPDRVRVDLNVNGPGDPFRLEPAALTMSLSPQRISAYGKLLLDILEGDPTLSIRDDEAEESWRIVEPILEHWRTGAVRMQTYPSGEAFEPTTTGGEPR